MASKVSFESTKALAVFFTVKKSLEPEIQPANFGRKKYGKKNTENTTWNPKHPFKNGWKL